MNNFIKLSLGALLLLGSAPALAEEQRDPYAWTMTCEYWEYRSQEILRDESIPLRYRWQLVAHFRTKVEGECKLPQDLSPWD